MFFFFAQTILGEFNKEQEAFIKNQQGAGGPGACPWSGHANEAKIKEEIMSLSAVRSDTKRHERWVVNLIFSNQKDRRNFVRAPPAGVEFEFDYDASYPTALAIMNEDKELEKMRFELVPKMWVAWGTSSELTVTTNYVYYFMYFVCNYRCCSITEESFWRNYFYRVSLICQAGDLGTLGDNNEFVRRGASEDTEGNVR